MLLLLVVMLPLSFLVAVVVMFGFAPLMIDLMAIARAAVKFGSAVMAVTVSANELDCPWRIGGGSDSC